MTMCAMACGISGAIVDTGDTKAALAELKKTSAEASALKHKVKALRMGITLSTWCCHL